MTLEGKIRRLVERFRAIDLLMLYLIAKAFAQDSDEAPRIHDELEYEVQEAIRSNEELAEREGNAIIAQAYVDGYDRDKRKDKATFALLAAAMLFGADRSVMNEAGWDAYSKTQQVIRNAMSNLPLRFRRAQLQAVNRAVDAYQRHPTSWQRAKQKALNDLADEGITHFIDQAGRQWSLDSYVEMGIRTGIANASRAGFDEAMERRGVDLVYCSAHAGACPLCVPWEGQILSRSGMNPNYPSVDDALSSGLFHPNCGHVFLEYIEGFSELKRYDSEENTQLYEDFQQQRYLERTLRKWKRREAAAITDEDRQRAAAYRKAWSRRIDQFTKEKGLARKRYREV